MQRQSDSIERQNVNVASYLNLPDPRLTAQQLQLEAAKKRESEERSRHPPQRQYNRKRSRGSMSEWFECSNQPERGQGSRGDERDSKKKKPVARSILDGMGLEHPSEEQ